MSKTVKNPAGFPSTLTPFSKKWNNGKTKVIRVPEAIADEILNYAHKLDNNNTIEHQLIDILQKNKDKVKGYSNNNCHQLIKDLKKLLGK